MVEETKICHKDGGEMLRDTKSMTFDYKGRSFTIPQPGWYCSSCDEAKFSLEDLRSTDELLLKTSGANIPMVLDAYFKFVSVTGCLARPEVVRIEEWHNEIIKFLWDRERWQIVLEVHLSGCVRVAFYNTHTGEFRYDDYESIDEISDGDPLIDRIIDHNEYFSTYEEEEEEEED
jgi:YgiT-type zinc finger domain-containing protein